MIKLKADEALFNKIQAFKGVVDHMAAAVQNDMEIDAKEFNQIAESLETNVEDFTKLASDLYNHLQKDQPVGDPNFLTQIVAEVKIVHHLTYGDGRMAKVEYNKKFGQRNDKTEMKGYSWTDAHASQEDERVYKTRINLQVERIQ